MPIHTECLLNMHMCINNNTTIRHVISLVLLSVLLPLGCTRHDQSSQLAESKVLETVVADFVNDWGMPGHPEAVPKRCYLQNTYRAVSADETAAAAAVGGSEARSAIAAIASGRSDAQLKLSSVPCALASSAEIEKLQISAHEYAGGILTLSHVGLDPAGENAAVVLNEARADIAGSTWILILKRSGDKWRIVRRTVIQRS